MTTSATVDALLQMLDRFVAGDLPFKTIEGNWVQVYLDAPESEYTEEEAEFFSNINEKLTFTTSLPTLDDDERGYGWVLADEFRQWLEALLAGPDRPA
jgi:hypothetical protein